MSLTIDKAAAKAIIDKLPDSATWDDLMHEIYLRIAIERGLADVAAGRTRSIHEVMREFGIDG